MYFVKYGTEYLHDPRTDDRVLIDIELEAAENTASMCEFTIYPDHPAYGTLKARDAKNEVVVYDGENEIFRGFIYELGSDFYLSGTVKCKGEFAYLGDSILPPYSTLEAEAYPNTVPSNPSAFFEWAIEKHNVQVGDEKRFTVGANHASNLDSNDYFYRSNEKHSTTADTVSEKLLDSLGGVLNVYHKDGVRYIDYLTEWDEVNAQIIDFGVNLIDYVKTDDALDVKSYIVPYGAAPDAEGDEKTFALTIEDYPDGPLDAEELYVKAGDRVYSVEAVDRYGWIGATYENRDANTVETLVLNALTELKRLESPKTTIEIKAVDLSLIDKKHSPISIGEFVRVRSRPHGFDSYMLCTSIELDLNNPENSIYTLGETFDTLTGTSNARIKALNSTINGVYEKAEALTDEAKSAAQTAREEAEKAKEAADKAVLSILEEYGTTDDPYSAPAGDWSSTPPEYESGMFVWRRMTTTYGDGTSVIGDPVLITGNTGDSGKDGEDAVLLRIDSSRGTVFKNSSISTVLSAVIYKGSARISDIAALRATFGAGAYLQWSWQKIDENLFGVISSSDSMVGDGGFTLTISADEVDEKCTFKCELII